MMIDLRNWAPGIRRARRKNLGKAAPSSEGPSGRPLSSEEPSSRALSSRAASAGSTNRRASAWMMICCVVAVAVFGAVALSGCRSKIFFTDGIGRSVTLEGVPKRIVSINPAHTETLFALGLGDKVVGVDEYSYRPKEAQEKEKVGDAFNLNLEKLVSLKPDLVIVAGSKDYPPSQVKELERLAIPAYVSGPSTIEEVLQDIETLSRAVGAGKKGDALVAEMRKSLDAVKDAAGEAPQNRPTVFFAVDQDLWTVGPASFVSDVIWAAGGQNVVKDVEEQYLQISMEVLLASDPDVILLTIPESEALALTSRPGWSDLRAVKGSRVHFVDPDLCSRPGPAVVQGVEEIASYLAP